MMLEILKQFKVREEIILKVRKYWNIDVWDFRHVVDITGINHINKRHGPTSKEKQEKIITVLDLELIEKIIFEADEIVTGGLSGSRKLPTLLYIKYIGEYKYYYVEEILKNKKELRIKTMFKDKKMP